MSFAERLNSESIYDTWEVASDLAAALEVCLQTVNRWEADRRLRRKGGRFHEAAVRVFVAQFRLE